MCGAAHADAGCELQSLSLPCVNKQPQRCRAADIAFTVVDNIIAMHCLRLGTATLYDFLLQPSMPSDGSQVPMFDPVAVVSYRERGSAGSSKALGPPATARYLPPCHAIELDSLTLFRCRLTLKHL